MGERYLNLGYLRQQLRNALLLGWIEILLD